MKIVEKNEKKMSDWLILIACQLVLGYFIPRGMEKAFIVLSYLPSLCSFLRDFFLHMTQLKMNNF